MTVYFSASHRSLMTNLQRYRTIVESMQKNGLVLASNWVEMAQYENLDAKPMRRWEEICDTSKQAIEDSDIVVVEATGGSCFGVGYELATALNANKPVLALVEKGQRKGSYVSGLKHPNLRFAEYTEADVAGIIRKFTLTARKGR